MYITYSYLGYVIQAILSQPSLSQPSEFLISVCELCQYFVIVTIMKH